jgi:Arc/MetJ-type ribon-helix-helix transcriptional regulator
MRQLNINVTPEFERDLTRLMKTRNIRSKSEALRIAVQEAADRAQGDRGFSAFTELLGAGLNGPSNPRPRFKSEDDLWS